MWKGGDMKLVKITSISQTHTNAAQEYDSKGQEGR